jgi:hypothetical protein
MKTMSKILDVVYQKNTKEDWDTVWVICGDEGSSKSNIGLRLLDEWYKRKNGQVTAEDIKHMCLTVELFKKDLGNGGKQECINLDEGGSLSNRRFMSKLNYEVSQAYQVIRGDNLFTIITLPDFFDLDPYFTKRRVRGLIYVYKRGRFCFWSKTRLRKLVALNMERKVKNYYIVNPTYAGGSFPRYSGPLLEPYMKLKAEKITEARNKFKIEAEGKQPKVDREKEIIARIAFKLGQGRVADALGISSKTVQRYQKEFDDTTGELSEDGNQ